MPGELLQGWSAKITVPARRITTVEQDIDTRFVSPAGRGHLRLWAGMVVDNRPWNLFHHFSTVIAAAFATGTYVLILSSIRKLSDAFGPLRLILLMLTSMTAMVGWLLISHDLWEPTRGRESLPLAVLYNWIAVLTLATAVLMAYAVLFALPAVAAVVFIPGGYLAATIGHPASFASYLLLAWTAASIATVGGTPGSGLESDEAVREATFGGRQQRRLEQVQSESANDDGA